MLPDTLQPYSDTVEVVEADELETARAIAETMISISEKTYADSGHATRSVHAKSHGILNGELEVLGGLPEPLAQGLFAKPGRYQAIIRFSSTPGDILHDSVSTPRGMSVKILGVEGERLEGSEQSTSQDFIMVNGKQFNAPNAQSFLKSLKLLAATTDRAEGLKILLAKTLRGIENLVEAVCSESALLKTMGGHPETHILGESFFAQLPFRHGSYIAKYALLPASADLQALKDAPLDVDSDPDALRHAVLDYFAHKPAEWDLCVQLSTNSTDMPVEDAAAVWDEQKSPFIPVARLTAPMQESWNAEKSGRVEDSVAFRPWNGLVEHRPLGSIMRMRKLAYKKSQDFRSQRNPVPVKEPEVDVTRSDRSTAA